MAFQTSATTKEGVLRDFYAHTMREDNRQGRVAPSVGVTSPIDASRIRDARSFMESVDAQRDQMFKRMGGHAADDNMTKTSDSYKQRRYDFVSKSEGVRRYSYKDHKGFTTVGVGFNMDAPGNWDQFKEVLGVDEDYANAVYKGEKALTPKQSRMLFEASVEEAEGIVLNKFQDVDLTEHERLALVSLAFNNPSLIGPNLTRLIKDGDKQGAIDEILYRSNRTKHRGLANRRYKEARMFAGSGGRDAIPNPNDYLKNLYG